MGLEYLQFCIVNQSKNEKKAYFNHHLDCAAPKRQSKCTTWINKLKLFYQYSLYGLNIQCLYTYLPSPITSQNKHNNDHQYPEKSSKSCLVTEENIDNALNGWVLWIVLNNVERTIKSFFLSLHFLVYLIPHSTYNFL